jgi:putative membrane protein
MTGRGGWFHLERTPADGSVPGWLLDPVLIALLLAIGGLYLYALTRREGGASRWRMASFVGALAIAFVVLQSPLDGLGELYMFWAHMLQHMVLVLVVAPLVLLGTPGWMLDWLLRAPAVRDVARRLTRPVAALVISQAVLLGWHAPALYEAALHDRHIHDLEHATFMAAGILMWWPVLSRSTRLPAASAQWLVPYLFVLPIPMSVLGALITFSQEIIYETYALAPRLWEVSALHDQEVSGLIMWVPGKMIFWLAMGVVFYRWFAREQARDRAESGSPSPG